VPELITDHAGAVELTSAHCIKLIWGNREAEYFLLLLWTEIRACASGDANQAKYGEGTHGARSKLFHRVIPGCAAGKMMRRCLARSTRILSLSRVKRRGHGGADLRREAAWFCGMRMGRGAGRSSGPIYRDGLTDGMIAVIEAAVMDHWKFGWGVFYGLLYVVGIIAFARKARRSKDIVYSPVGLVVAFLAVGLVIYVIFIVQP
jgi:hypothetical protein